MFIPKDDKLPARVEEWIEKKFPIEDHMPFNPDVRTNDKRAGARAMYEKLAPLAAFTVWEASVSHDDHCNPEACSCRVGAAKEALKESGLEDEDDDT